MPNFSLAMEKLCYLVRSACLVVLGKNMGCPNCGTVSKEVTDRKYFFTTLRRCPSCRILYRAPTTPAAEQATFYQKKYSQGFTTDLPGPQELKELVTTEFRGTERDYRGYILLLTNLGIRPGSRILEYGCSWGYGAWQLQKAGFRVTAFEISEPRCRYAREKLGIHAVDDPGEIKGRYDAIFSAHVLEHVDSVEKVFTKKMEHLQPGGWLVGVTPNGSVAYRKKNPGKFHRLWGLVHPQLLDEEFLQKRFSGMDLRIGSISAGERLDPLKPAGEVNSELDKWELVFAVRTLPAANH